MSETFSTPPSTMSRSEFVDTFGGIYEHSPWVAEQVFEQGLGPQHNRLEVLAEVMARVVASADRDLQLKLILAHPDLAGKAAVAGDLTDASTDEQASAGLDQCSPEEFECFRQLNDAYRNRFQFPFIMAVKHSNRQQILAAFEQRLAHDPETEFATALSEINKIAQIRLQTMISG